MPAADRPGRYGPPPLGQRYPSFELIVVDRPEEPSVRLSPVFNERGVSYYAVCGRGPQAAKNYGIALAHGAIILTVDDDIIPGPDLIVRYVDNYRDPRVGTVGGVVFPAGEPPVRMRGPAGHREKGFI